MNLARQQLIEQCADDITKKLFGSPVQDTIRRLRGELKKKVRQVGITEVELQEEVALILETQKSVLEKASAEDQELAALHAVEQVLRGKKRKYILPMTEEQDDLMEDDLGERFKVACILEISKASEKKGRALSEQETLEVGQHILEDTIEGQRLMLKTAVELKYPGAEVQGQWPRKAIFETEDGDLFRVGYWVLKGKCAVELGEPEKMEWVLLPEKTIGAIHKGEEEAENAYAYVQYLAGVRLPPTPDPEPVDPESLTEQQRMTMKLAGFVKSVSSSETEVDTHTLTEQEKYTRDLCGLTDRLWDGR